MTVLSRALLTLEGTLRTIDPTFNIANEAETHLPELAGDQSGEMKQQLEKELVRALPSLRTLPGHAESIATQLRSGRLSMRDRALHRARPRRRRRLGRPRHLRRHRHLRAAQLGAAAAGGGVVGNDHDDFRNTLQLIGFLGIIVTAVSRCASVAHLLRSENRTGSPIAECERAASARAGRRKAR